MIDLITPTNQSISEHLSGINTFLCCFPQSDVQNFREDFLRNGPMVDGIAPNDAVDRLSRFKEEFKIRERKMDSYRG